ncbi:FecR family protein [Mucilaginibacter frigoritolerans]|uniref:FecR family protein n=1 Tax=Mucilaginibacter frigoritolerans TaxID=652788 RepID=A0A562U7S9_9SPHI|nr:FecR family protein [Mucilaginibacter frigoritolerans]TWJ01679.1 FecR family protein [Mucilaginibacter frigoritolerans]
MAALNNTELKQLLEKEQLGSLTPSEQQLLDEWYNSFDLNQQDLLVFKDPTHELQVRERLLNRIMEAGFTNVAPEKVAKQRNLIQWFSAAAIFLMIIGAVAFWKYAGSSAEKKEVLLSAVTENGMLKEIKLDDGTAIWLNAGSKITYPEHFLNRKREVYLDGEAYFDVIHDASRPFIVHTNHLITTVLGTAFSVTAYKNTSIQLVTVNRGKVAVAHDHNTLGFLTPNKQIEYNIKSGKSYLTDVDASSQMSWKDGKLQFENQDMQNIAARLGRWYGYSFKFEHRNIENCRYTASFNNKIPLNNLLRIMKAISLVNYKIDDAAKTVTFLGAGCNE